MEALPHEGDSIETSYEAFVGRFGTHFTKEIVLGGLAYQRISGSSKRYLKSWSTEQEFKAKAGIEIEKVKGGASSEVAKAEASKSDSQFGLERTALDFRGGTGDPSGINSSWISSLRENPTIVKAVMEPLSRLLILRFFPTAEEDLLDAKRLYLEFASRNWIMTKGSPGCDKPPLKYGEPFAISIRRADGTFRSVDRLSPNSMIGFGPVKRDSDGKSAALALESVEGRRAGSIVLAGDKLRIKVLSTGRDLIAGAGGSEFCIMRAGDNPYQPNRLGEYFLESDEVIFFTGQPGNPQWAIGTSLTGNYFDAGNPKAGFTCTPFSLKRSNKLED